MLQSRLVKTSTSIVILRGGGDLASGVALRLHRVGIKVVITEIAQPLAVRRLVSFAEAVYSGAMAVEGITARLIDTPSMASEVLERDEIPVLVDPNATVLHSDFCIRALVDARMTKKSPDLGMEAAPLVIGLGPGFWASQNCHAAIETNRGHTLGRVYWQGAPESDTGIPAAVARKQSERVLRAPTAGLLHTLVDIGAWVKQGDLLSTVADQPIHAPFSGLLRGFLHDGLPVTAGMKIGDIRIEFNGEFDALQTIFKSLARYAEEKGGVDRQAHLFSRLHRLAGLLRGNALSNGV